VNKAKIFEDYNIALDSYAAPAPKNLFLLPNRRYRHAEFQGKFPLKWKEAGKIFMGWSQIRMEWQGSFQLATKCFDPQPRRGFFVSSCLISIQGPCLILIMYLIIVMNTYRNRAIESTKLTDKGGDYYRGYEKGLTVWRLLPSRQGALPIMCACARTEFDADPVAKKYLGWIESLDFFATQIKKAPNTFYILVTKPTLMFGEEMVKIWSNLSCSPNNYQTVFHYWTNSPSGWSFWYLNSHRPKNLAYWSW